MQRNDYKKFAECMGGLQETFTPEKPVSKNKMEFYFQIFQDVSIEQFQRACYDICRNRKITSTFPVPAEIKEAIQGNPEDESVKAFNVFIEGKAQTGIYDSVEFADKSIHAVIQAFGGWEKICLIEEDQWKFRRKEWIEAYKIFKKNPRNDTPGRLIGLIEGYNGQNPEWGKYTHKTIFIGNDGVSRKQIEHKEEVKVLE